jgi:hypothetical protein
MPRQLDEFPAARNARYPWDQLLDGSVWELVKGDDYTSRSTTIMANARTQAKRRNGTARIRLLRQNGNESVVLQFVRASS